MGKEKSWNKRELRNVQFKENYKYYIKFIFYTYYVFITLLKGAKKLR